MYGGVERTRPSTVLLPPAPQAGASASSATTAQWKQHHSICESRRSQEQEGSSHAGLKSPTLQKAENQHGSRPPRSGYMPPTLQSPRPVIAAELRLSRRRPH